MRASHSPPESPLSSTVGNSTSSHALGFGRGSVYDKLLHNSAWTPRRGTSKESSFLEDTEKAMRDVAAAAKTDPDMDASWCQQCVPILVERLLRTPWRTLVEAWIRNFHRLHEHQHRNNSLRAENPKLQNPAADQCVEQQKVLMDGVIALIVEALVRHVASPQPYWALEPLGRILDPNQPLYAKPRSKDYDIYEERGMFTSMLFNDRAPKMVRKLKGHAIQLNHLAWDSFFKLNGPEQVTSIICRALENRVPASTGGELARVFSLIQKLPRTWQGSRTHTDKVCAELSHAVSWFRDQGGKPSQRNVQLLSAILKGLQQLGQGDDTELVVNEEYDLLQSVEVRQRQDDAYASNTFELKPPAVVKVHRVEEKQRYVSRIYFPSASEVEHVTVAEITCGEVEGWIDVKQARRFHNPTLRRRQVGLAKSWVEPLVTSTTRELCASCMQQPADDQELRLEALKLLEEVCAQSRDEKDLVPWLQKFRVVDLLRDEVLTLDSVDQERVNRAISLLQHPIPYTDDLHNLLLYVIRDEREMCRNSGKQLANALVQRDDIPPRLLPALFQTLGSEILRRDSSPEALMSRLHVIRFALEGAKAWRHADSAVQLFVRALWSAAGGPEDAAGNWTRTVLMQEWCRRWGRERDKALESLAEPTFRELLRLLAKPSLQAHSPDAAAAANTSTFAWTLEPGDFVAIGQSSGVLRSLKSSDASKPSLVTLADGSLVAAASISQTTYSSSVSSRPTSSFKSTVTPTDFEAQVTVEECRARVPLLLSMLQAVLEGMRGSPSQVWGLSLSSKSRRSEFIHATDHREQLTEVVLSELAMFARGEVRSAGVPGAPAAAAERAAAGLERRLEFVSYAFRHAARQELSLLRIIQLCEYFLVPLHIPIRVRDVFLGWLRMVFAWPSDDSSSSTEVTPVGRILAPRQALQAARLVLDLLQEMLVGSPAHRRMPLGFRGYFLYVQLMMEVNGDSGLGLVDLQDDLGRRVGARRYSVGLTAPAAGGKHGHREGDWIKVWATAGTGPKDGFLAQHIGASRYRVVYVDGAEDVLELELRGGPVWQHLPDPDQQLPQQPSFAQVRTLQLEGLAGLWFCALLVEEPLCSHAQVLLLRLYDCIRRVPHEGSSAHHVRPSGKSMPPDVWQSDIAAWTTGVQGKDLSADLATMHLRGPGATPLGGPISVPAGLRSGSCAQDGAEEWPVPSVKVEEDALVACARLILERCTTLLSTCNPLLLPTLQLLRNYLEGCRAERASERSMLAAGRGWDTMWLSVQVEAAQQPEAKVSGYGYRRKSMESEIHPSDRLAIPRRAISDCVTVSELQAGILEWARPRGGRRNDVLSLLQRRLQAFDGVLELSLRRTGQALRSDMLTLHELGLGHEAEILAVLPFQGQQTSKHYVPKPRSSQIGVPEMLSRSNEFFKLLWRCIEVSTVTNGSGPGVSGPTDVHRAVWGVLLLLPPQASLVSAMDHPGGPEAAPIWSKLQRPNVDLGMLMEALYVAQLVDARLAPPGLAVNSRPEGPGAPNLMSSWVTEVADIEKRAQRWRQEFLKSPGWPWLVSLITTMLPSDHIPTILMQTGLPAALRALYFLLAGATLAQRLDDADDGRGNSEDDSEQPLPSRAFSHASGMQVVRSSSVDISKLVFQLNGILESAVRVLASTADENPELNLARCGRAAVGSLHAAMAVDNPEGAVAAKMAAQALIHAACTNGSSALAAVRKGALEALRDVCQESQAQAAWVLEALTSWVEEATETSEEACELLAEVSVESLNWGGDQAANQEESACRLALRQLLAKLADQLLAPAASVVTADSPSSKQETERARLAATVLTRVLQQRQGREDQVDMLRTLVDQSAPSRRQRTLAKELLSQYVLPTRIAVPASLRALVGDVVTLLLRPENAYQIVGHVAHWLEGMTPPVKEGGAEGEIDWDVGARQLGVRQEGGVAHMGLANQGMTCYLNSVVQQLFWIPPIRNLLTKYEGAGDEPGIMENLRQTFFNMEHGAGSSYNPRKLVQACDALRLEYGVWSQNDAAEFFDRLVDYVQTKMHPSPGGTPASTSSATADVETSREELMSPLEEVPKGLPGLSLSGLLRGSRVRQKRCLVCNTVTRGVEEPFFKLEVPTRALLEGGYSAEHHSLTDALQAMTEPEFMRGDNKVECDACGNRRTETEFCTSISVLPPYLFVQLKRFDFNLRTMRQEKLNHEVKFPLDLDMWPYSSDAVAAASGSAQAQEDERPERVHRSTSSESQMVPVVSHCLKGDPNRFSYELVGVLVHTGAAGSGHYYSIVSVPGADGTDAKRHWMEFNDNIVEPVDVGEIVDRFAGGPGSMRSAYMLLYRRCNVEATLLPNPKPYGASRTTESSTAMTEDVLQPFLPGDKVLVWSKAQDRWVHDGVVCEFAAEPDGQSAEGVLPGSVRVRYDCGAREKWVPPLELHRQLMRQSDAEGPHPKHIGDDLMQPVEGWGDREMLRHQVVFSEAFLSFALQLVQFVVGHSSATGSAEDLLLLVARCLFDIVVHFQWEGRRLEWEQLLVNIIKNCCDLAAVERLLSMCCERGSGDSSWAGKFCFRCPHKEACPVATTVVREALIRLSLEPRPSADTLHRVVHFVVRHTQSKHGKSGRLVYFVKGITESREACRALSTLPASDLMGAVVSIYLKSQKLMRNSFQPDPSDVTMMRYSKRALVALADALPHGPEVDDLLSDWSKEQLTSPDLSFQNWGKEAANSLVSLVLRLGGEDRLLQEIACHVAYEDGLKKSDYAQKMSSLKRLLEHPVSEQGVINMRWRTLAQQIHAMQREHLNDQGGIKEQGDVGECMVMLMSQLGAIVLEMARDPARAAELRQVERAINDSAGVYVKVGGWLSTRALKPPSRGDSERSSRAAEARHSLVAMLRSLGMEKVARAVETQVRLPDLRASEHEADPESERSRDEEPAHSAAWVLKSPLRDKSAQAAGSRAASGTPQSGAAGSRAVSGTPLSGATGSRAASGTPQSGTVVSPPGSDKSNTRGSPATVASRGWSCMFRHDSRPSH